jgi:glycerophosphoryl diester phosphodiesterase
VLAHRGSADPEQGVRENSLEAFDLAAELGADGVELDVRRTADGHLVVHHDALVPVPDGWAPGSRSVESRPHPVTGEVASGLRIETTRRHLLPAWLPGLDEALSLCLQAGLFVNVEVKSEAGGPSVDPGQLCARSTAAACAAVPAGAAIVISSFSVPALQAARATAPEAALAWLFEPRTPLAAGDGGQPVSWPAVAAGLSGGGPLQALAELDLEGLHPYYRLASETLVAGAHEFGLAVRTWTVDRAERIAANAAAGVDAVITNDVAGALAVLGRSRPGRPLQA